MASTQDRLDRARKYLDTFVESWRADHEAAMDCRYLEERLAEAVKVFGLVDGLVRSRRENVFRGQEDPNAELDTAEKNLFAALLPLAEEGLGRLADFERTFGQVEGATSFREAYERIRAFLANWAPAVPARAIGSLMMDLSEQDADEIRSLLEAPAGSPGHLKGEPRSVPLGDPSRLR